MATKPASQSRITTPTTKASNDRVPLRAVAKPTPKPVSGTASMPDVIVQAVQAAVSLPVSETPVAVMPASPMAVPSPVLSVAAPPLAVAGPLPKINKMQETIMSTAEEFMAFSQGNIEAFVKSGQIWATGLQDLSKHLAASAKEQMDYSMSTWKSLSGVKSIKEALDIQTGLARESLEKAVAETGKLTDASMKLAEQAIAPITARITLATEKFGKTATV